MGPAVFLADKGILRPSTYPALEVIYTPWEWVHFHTPLYKPMGMYMHLWAPETFTKDGNIRGRDPR